MPKKTLRAKCLEAAQKLARLQEADDNGYVSCWSCGKIDHYKSMDGAHFISKGNGGTNYWALDMRNIHVQCKGCNGFGMKYGDAYPRYTMKMIDTYGREFVDELLTKNPVRKLSRIELQDMLDEFKREIKRHEDRIS